MAQITLTSNDLLASILEVEKRVAKVDRMNSLLLEKGYDDLAAHIRKEVFGSGRDCTKFFLASQKARVLILSEEDLIGAANALRSLTGSAEVLERDAKRREKYLPKSEEIIYTSDDVHNEGV